MNFKQGVIYMDDTARESVHEIRDTDTGGSAAALNSQERVDLLKSTIPHVTLEIDETE